MATQYTPILQLALPVTGELNGTWGEVVNDNITSMVEEAIAGLATISTWTANSHTLTTANGTTDEARCAMLVAQTGSGGSALTGVGEIICPDRTKLFVLQNASSYAVTLKTSAGTGIAVAAGDTAFLFCDGTNVNACVTQIINGHVTGNLTVDGNTTLGNSTSDTITATARVASDLNPSADNTYDLGTSGNSWRNLYIDGTATIATLNVTTIDTTNIEVTNIKAKDGTAAITIADTTGAVTVATDFAANGNSTLGNATSDTVTYNARAASSFLPAADNTYDLGTSGNSWKDVYADGTVNTTTVDTTNIEVTNIKAKDGSAAGSIADATGVVTLNSAVLTTADINGGTIDNATIGATTAAPGSFTQVNITGQGDLRLEDTTGGEYVALQAPGTLAASYTLTMPADDGTAGQLLATDGSGNLSWSTSAGDVAGPASATDNAIARFDGTTGKLIQNSAVTIDDTTGSMTFTGTAARISGDMSNATVANRLMFQSTTTNGATSLGLIPNGTNTTTGFSCFNNQDPTNASLIGFVSSSTEGRLQAGKVGTGTYLPITFYTNGSEQMRLDTAGSLGLGVTPSAWGLGKAIEVGNAGNSIWGAQARDLRLLVNGYYTGSQYTYSSTGYAARYDVNNGTLGGHAWYTAPSGTAGNAITFTQAMTLDTSGNLQLGTTTAVTSNGTNLNLYGASASNLSLQNGTTGTGNGVGFQLIQDGTTTYIYNRANGSMLFATNNTERVRIDTAGNVILATGSLQEHKTAIGASALDMSTGNYFSKTITTTTTFTVSNVPTTGTAMSLILDLTNGGSSTVTWWSGVKWASGTAPTLTASGRDVLGFFTYDGGTTWSGFVLGLNLS